MALHLVHHWPGSEFIRLTPWNCYDRNRHSAVFNSLNDLKSWTSERAQGMADAGHERHTILTLDMVPKHAKELLCGGSLYWAIDGHVTARQMLLDIWPIWARGIEICNIMLGPDVIETARQPCELPSWWRYLKQDETPPDLASWGIQ